MQKLMLIILTCALFSSHVAQQSRADELISQTLKNTLTLVDMRVLKHFIVVGNHTLSFTERGLL